MNIVYKRKSATVKTLNRSLKSLNNETWVYGTGKISPFDYHSIDVLSAHKIMDLANHNLSDYYLWRKYVKKDIKIDATPAMIEGSALHCMVLEPKEFENRYAVLPDNIDRRTKEGKEQYAQFQLTAKGKDVINRTQHRKILSMAHAIKTNAYSGHLLLDTHKEVSAFTKYKDVVIKGRADAVCYKKDDDVGYIIDVKTASDVSPIAFNQAVARYRYDIQAEIYKKIFNVSDFIFICVNKSDPYEVAIYDLNDEYKEKAKIDIDNAIDRWTTVKQKNEPEGFTKATDPIVCLAPPKWFIYQ